MKRSSIFETMEEKFLKMSNIEMLGMALVARDEIISFLQNLEFSDMDIFRVLLAATAIGTLGDRVLCSEEKEMIEDVFVGVWNVDTDKVCDMLKQISMEDAFGLLKEVMVLGGEFLSSILTYIWSFAYIDGVLETEVEQRLDKIFGFSLVDEVLKKDV